MSNAASAIDPEFDLIALAISLKARGHHPKLSRLIEKTVSVCSAHEDLRACSECLRDLKIFTSSKTIPKELDYQTLGTVAGTLSAYSIILYCRATQTSTGNRRGWFGLEILDDAQRNLHRRIKRLRDNAIAHFGFGQEHPEGPLIREVLVWSLTSSVPRPVFHASWAMNKTRFTDDFENLVQHVRKAANERASRHMDDTASELIKVGAVDKSLACAIEEHPFDPDRFFVSPDSRTDIYNALQGNNVATVHIATVADESEES